MNIKQILDSKSKSFCAAKWYNATIWLGSGMTTSCHHPPAHKINEAEVKENPRALHNTFEKKEDRRLMQEGERPSGCSYCWKVEDTPNGGISDRIYKSQIYNEQALDQAFDTPHQDDVNLKTLEIAFDRTCNFACSYCNPAFSSTWVRDIKQNGPYEGLTTDGRHHFTHTHDGSQLFGLQDQNPYVNAFFKWWETDLQYTLQELRITGGEPIMSPHFWKLVDWFKSNKAHDDLQFAVNSNLCAKPELIQKLRDAASSIPNFHLYTSCEAIGTQAEYIRDGLKFHDWFSNLRSFLDTPANLHVMCTINALCLESLPEFLRLMLMLKEKHAQPTFTLNILRFPSFQSVHVLPIDLKQKYADDLQIIRDEMDTRQCHEMEKNHVDRLIAYLRASPEMTQLKSDFKLFYEQYDKRRGKNFDTTFSKELVEWKK